MSILVEARNLTKVFETPAGIVAAVNGVSFTIERGQTLGLVGESGSGKSTVARLLLRLHEPTDGEIIFDGVDMRAAHGKELRSLRRRMQMVFQDPYSSLLPHFTAADNVAEPLRLHGQGDKAARRDEARRLLELVGLSRQAADRYPHEFSGGQQQRIAIARALALQPDLLICDEPTSSLDVSIQAQILNLLEDLQSRFGLAYLFISHNLAVVEHRATRVAVMYKGRLVEGAPTATLFSEPIHPYTRSLLSAVLPVTGPGPLPVSARDRDQRRLIEQASDVGDSTLHEVAPGHYVAGADTVEVTGAA